MKFVGVLVVLTLSIGLIAWEGTWRINHTLPSAISSPSEGRYVAQIRSLPEGSELPYGQGVFVRGRYIPLWAMSTLVFAGYCEPDMQLKWLTARELAVGCNVAEGDPKLFAPPDGVVVKRSNG